MGDWTESKYTETRFGGMDKAVEPHTLDRDGGIMHDEFNMMSRTQGLRTRKGWRLSDDLSLYVSSLPGKPKPPLALIGYETNLATVAEDDEDDDDGGDGGVIIGGLTGGGDDDVTPGGGGSGVSLTLTTPQAVVAEVPFSVSSGASAHYTGSNAHLEWSFAPDGRPSVSLAKGIRSGWNDNAWSTSATIWTADRSRTGVTAVLKKGSGVQATKNMGYSVASMIPSLPSSVPYRQDFTLTVSCKLGGATQTYYEGNGRGVAISWQAFDENDNPVSCHVRCSQTGWTNGVGTYSAYLSSVAPTAVRLKAVVTYAGESQTADADISGVGLLRVPSALHVFGGGGTMRINAVGLIPSSLSIVASVDGQAVNLSDYLELADGTPINTSQRWDDNIWEHDIQAKTSAPAATLTLKLMNGDTELASETVTIANALTATIDTDASIKPGETIAASATISATGHTITRLPAEVVELQILGIDDDVFVENEDNELELSASLENAVSGTYTVQVVDLRDDTVLASTDVVVENIYGALAEAINERMAVKHVDILTDGDYNITSYTEDTSPATLAAATITAMKEFSNDDFDESDGTFGKYTDSNTGVATSQPQDMTEEQWMKDCYNKIKQATTLVGKTNSFAIDGICDFTSETKEPSSASRFVDTDHVYTQEYCVDKAKDAARSDYNAKSPTTGTSHDARLQSFVWKFESHEAMAKLVSLTTRATMNYGFPTSCTMKLFFEINDDGNVFYDFGQGWTEGSYPCMATWTQQANATGAVSPIISLGSPTFSSAQNGNNSIHCDCRASLNAMSIKFDFEHK